MGGATKLIVTVDESRGILVSEAERAQPRLVVHAEQKIPTRSTIALCVPAGAARMFSRFCMRTRPHRSGEESRKMPKLVRSGPGYWRSRNQREIGVKRERCGPLEPPVVIREGQDVPSAAALATKCTTSGPGSSNWGRSTRALTTSGRLGVATAPWIFWGPPLDLVLGCRLGGRESAGACRQVRTETGILQSATKYIIEGNRGEVVASEARNAWRTRA